jgi:TolB-like protein
MSNYMKKTALIIPVLIVAFIAGAAQKSTIAVMSFDSNAGGDLGVAVSEIVRSEFAALDDLPYVVVERTMLNKVMKEQELSLTGAVSDSKASQIGKILYADHLLMGRIISFGGRYRINARIVETATSIVIKEASETVSSENDLPHAAKAVAWRLLDKNYSYTPEVPERKVEKADKAVKQDPGAGITYSSMYTDASGIHRGGRIVLTFLDDAVAGYTEESIGRAEMHGTLKGSIIAGYYRASYGFGNFTFTVSPDRDELIGDYYQVSNGAHGDWIAVKGETFRLPGSLYTGKWKAGDRCLSKWSGDAYWYPARIAETGDGMYFVVYDDGDREWRFEKYLQPEKIGSGDVVFGNWLGKGRYYRGRVTERKGDNIHVSYDDGDQEWTTVGRVRLMME